jgi:hypothetical protein
MTSVYKQLYDELSDVDYLINKLFMQRQEITGKLARLEAQTTMRARGEFFQRMVSEIMLVKDPVQSLLHANTRLLPWRHNLPRMYFPRTLEVMPEGYPSNWTTCQSYRFFASLSKAVEDDLASL